MIPVFKPSLGREEEKEVLDTLRSNWIGNGPKTKRFEEEFLKYTGGQYGVALNSASAALHLALVSLNLKKEDEVITPSLTFIATNHPILLVGATPVFCDVVGSTLCADPVDIAKKITKKTKAIIVVHYGGNPVDLGPIIALCKKHKLALIEDCSHAEGTLYKGRHVGTLGNFGCFSFAAIKNMTTGDGGMLIGKNKKLIEYARALSWSGISQGTWDRTRGKRLKWEYDVIAPGWKYQMNDIAASIGLVQLKKLDLNNKKRRKVAGNYIQLLKKNSWIMLPQESMFGKTSWHNFPIRVPASIRDNLSTYLAKKGIATTVHYMPSHLYKLYSGYSHNVPVTNKIWKSLLLLPIFPELSIKDQLYVIKTLKNFKP